VDKSGFIDLVQTMTIYENPTSSFIIVLPMNDDDDILFCCLFVYLPRYMTICFQYLKTRLFMTCETILLEF
jgi:hypothetical protein